MDFIKSLPESSGIDNVLVVVDMLSKYAHFIGFKHPFTGNLVVSIFIEEVVKLHNFTVSIVSDRDKNFMSLFWKESFRLHRTNLLRTTSYHPQTNVPKMLHQWPSCLVGFPCLLSVIMPHHILPSKCPRSRHYMVKLHPPFVLV